MAPRVKTASQYRRCRSGYVLRIEGNYPIDLTTRFSRPSYLYTPVHEDDMPSLRKTCECCGRITMNTRFCTRSCFVKWRRGKPFPTISSTTKEADQLRSKCYSFLPTCGLMMKYIVIDPEVRYPTHYS